MMTLFFDVYPNKPKKKWTANAINIKISWTTLLYLLQFNINTEDESSSQI
jgi:hypothetical protein